MERRGFYCIYKSNIACLFDSLTFSEEIFMERRGRTKLGSFENLHHLFLYAIRTSIWLKEAVLWNCVLCHEGNDGKFNRIGFIEFGDTLGVNFFRNFFPISLSFQFQLRSTSWQINRKRSKLVALNLTINSERKETFCLEKRLVA